jgi:hypothetical protein
LTFSLPWVKKKNCQTQPIIAQKTGGTEEGTEMSDESKKEAGLPGKKVKAGLFWSTTPKKIVLISR